MSEIKKSKAGEVGSGLGAELSVVMCSAECAFSALAFSRAQYHTASEVRPGALTSCMSMKRMKPLCSVVTAEPQREPPHDCFNNQTQAPSY